MNKREPEWTTAGGEYVPAEFVPRGPVRPANAIIRGLLTLTLIDLFFPLFCEKITGTVARMDRKNMPKSWKKKHGPGYGTYAAGHSDRHAHLWFEEHGDMMIGYAFSQTLHQTKVGDQITVWVKPWSGSVRRLRNHTKPRKWWQY